MGSLRHLSYQTRKYKQKVYKSFFLAESYREGKTVRKRTICSLGSLTETQQEQIQLICQTISTPSHLLTTLDDIVVQDSHPYLALAVADALWTHWRLSQAFGPNIRESPLSKPLVARVLTLNRWVAPCAHYSIPDWIQHTAVSEVIGESLDALNDDKIYYELDKIDPSQESLEQHLFHLTSCNDPTSYQWVNYDLSSSYFVGTSGPLAAYGKSKDQKPPHKQVLLGLLVNKVGYPFKWHVYPGNTSENFKASLLHHGFVTYDDDLYAKDLGVIGPHRYILGFNPGLWHEERMTRHEKLACFEDVVAQTNQALRHAKRSRQAEPTQRAILDKLRTLKIRKYFQSPILRDLTIPRSAQHGTGAPVQSFHITVPPHPTNLAKSELLDGLCVFISNHCETTDGHCVSLDTLIRSYREQSVIEDVFKHLKSLFTLTMLNFQKVDRNTMVGPNIFHVYERNMGIVTSNHRRISRGVIGIPSRICATVSDENTGCVRAWVDRTQGEFADGGNA